MTWVGAVVSSCRARTRKSTTGRRWRSAPALCPWAGGASVRQRRQSARSQDGAGGGEPCGRAASDAGTPVAPNRLHAAGCGAGGVRRRLPPPHPAWRTIVRGLEIVLNVREDAADGRSQQDQDADDHDGDQRDDQRVLHEALAAVVAEQTVQHTGPPVLSESHLPTALTTEPGPQDNDAWSEYRHPARGSSRGGCRVQAAWSMRPASPSSRPVRHPGGGTRQGRRGGVGAPARRPVGFSLAGTPPGGRVAGSLAQAAATQETLDGSRHANGCRGRHQCGPYPSAQQVCASTKGDESQHDCAARRSHVVSCTTAETEGAYY